jgi:hypothetical protein
MATAPKSPAHPADRTGETTGGAAQRGAASTQKPKEDKGPVASARVTPQHPFGSEPRILDLKTGVMTPQERDNAHGGLYRNKEKK